MTSIGGQAVIEGVMMKAPQKIATAVRKSNGEIIIDKKSRAIIVYVTTFLFLIFIKRLVFYFIV